MFACCNNCEKKSNRGAGMNESFDPEQPEIAVPRERGVASGPRNHLDPNIMLLDSTNLVQNGKSNKPNVEIIQNIFQHNTQSMQEICKIKDRNLDFMQETNTSTNGHSVKIREAFRKNEPQWNIDIFQGPQKDNSPVNEALLNNESRWNIPQYQDSQKDNAPGNEVFLNNEFQRNIAQFQGSQIRAPGKEGFLNNKCQWNIAQYHGSQKENAPVNRAFRNNECQWNMSKFHVSQMDDALVKISDPREPFGENVHFGDSILAVPGPSGFHGNQNVPNVLDEKLKSSNASEIRSNELRKKPKIFLCKFCGKGIDEHTKRDASGYQLYFCCVCKYENYKAPNLQVHIRIHCPKDDCSVCSKEHSDGILHNAEQICHLCLVTFNCRTQLDEHLLEHHRPHFEEHCWGCSLSICDHYTVRKGKKRYFCCICGFNTRRRDYILFHNDRHRPKRFCRICREEYPDEQKGLHNREYSCIMCNKEFKCRTQLEDHYKEDYSHVDFFSKHCRFCSQALYKHEGEENQYYMCCAYECPHESKFLSDLQFHILKHPGLGIFKCGKCGKRYQKERGLIKHSSTCIPSPFPCEICRARFPSRDSLNKHSLEKHRPDIRFPV